MSSFHRRKVRTGLGNREKRAELIKQRSKRQKEELLDIKRGLPLGEVSNDSEMSVETKPTNNRGKLFQRINGWQKSLQKIKLKKCTKSSGKPTSCKVEDSAGNRMLFPGQSEVNETESMPNDKLNNKETGLQLWSTQLSVTKVGQMSSQISGLHWSKENIEYNNAQFVKKDKEYLTVAHEEIDGNDCHKDLSTAGVMGSAHKDSLLMRLWSQQPLVVASGILESLSSKQLKHQEAMYELISSEQTYLSSLDISIQHFLEASRSPTQEGCATFMVPWQHEAIFSNLSEVRDASSAFLAVLQERQRVGVVISPIADVILEFVRNAC